MNNKHRTLLVLGALTAFGVLAVESSRPLPAVSPPPDKDVTVVNTAGNPVPVTGHISVSGTSTVTGNVAASQSGAWTVGINPAQNTVKVQPSPGFFHDDGFGVINDGATIDLGPFDTSGLAQLRIMCRAVNGDMRFQVLANVAPAFPITLDDFTLGGEGGTVSGTRVYDAPPPSVIIRLTEGGPGGSNYHVVFVGH